MKKIFVLLVIMIFTQTFAQNLGYTGKLIQGGVEDGEKLIKAYIKPLNKAIVFGMSGVSFMKAQNSIDEKKFFGGIKTVVMQIPKEDLLYDVSKLGLKYIEAKDPTKTMAPSVFGDSIRTIRLASKTHDLFGRPLYEFDAPTGKETNIMPLPYLTVGYRMKKSVFSINLIPYIKVPTTDMNIGMLGLSYQQDLSAFIEALDNKNYGLDIQGGYSLMYGHEKLSVKPDGVYIPVSVTLHQTGPYDDQKINIFYNSISLNIYGHYTLNNKFTFFAGTGLVSGTTNIKVLGRYPVYGEDPSHTGAVIGEDIDDPININENYSQMLMELGAQVEWKRILVQMKYNIAHYGGFGINLSYKFL